jgi:hypothetical protein
VTLRKGSRANPLTVNDLPFTVPEAGRYWLLYGNELMELPESPEGSVLDLQKQPSLRERPE